MAVTNPGFTVPLGTVKDSNGKSVPLYISPEWQIFFQGLFDRTGGSEGDRITALEEQDTLLLSLSDDAQSLAAQANRTARINRETTIAHAARLKEIEFLGAFSWE